MKSSLLQIFICCFLSVLTVSGQEKNVIFPDGTTVFFENKIASALSDKSDVKVRVMNVLSAMGNVNVVHRVFIDRQDKSHFGYDLEIKKETEKGKYTVTFKPLSVVLFVNNSDGRSLPKFPESLQISEGDTVSVDLLENPKTKEKIADLIKIVQGEPNQKTSQMNQIIVPNIPNSRVTQMTRTTQIFESGSDVEPKDFTINEVRLQVAGAALFINGKQFADKKSFVAGNIYFYLKGKGRFILSPVPREGFNFKKTGTIDGSKISFEMGGDKYEINSVLPAMYYGGKWNLWVLHEPEYRPKSDVEEEFGGGSIESLMQPKSK